MKKKRIVIVTLALVACILFSGYFFGKKASIKAEETTKVITTWDELAASYADSTVTSVTLGNDIAYGVGGSTALRAGRTTSFSIDGNGHNLDLQTQVFNVTQSSTATFTIKNIPLLNSTNPYTVTGVVTSGDANTANSGWTINFSDVNSSTTNTMRIASVSGAQLNLGGNIKWYTRSEMAVVDGVRIEENAKVIGLKRSSSENRSFFWYAQSSMSTSTAGTHNFEVGKNASANFKMDNGGPTYPVVYAYYKTLHLETGATFNGTMQGNAFRADYANSSFIADGNNKINLTSLSSGSAPVRFQYASTETAQFYVGPGSEVYIIAATNSPLFDASYNTATVAGKVSIVLDSPKNYDLRNYSTANTVNSSISNNAFKEFSIKNSDINVWKLADNVSGPSTYASTKVDYLTQSGSTTVTSSDTTLASYLPLNKVRRLSGLNQDPVIKFVDVTNAQKTINFQTILGYVPDEKGIDENGDVTYVPVYPSVAGQTTADITDTYEKKYLGVASTADGSTTVSTDKLNQANKNVSGISYYGSRTQLEATTYKVWDVVPPDPANITTTDIAEGASILEGTGEVGATVYLDIDGTRITAATSTVDTDGKWKVTFDKSLSKKGSVATIFLEDKAGKADIANPPATNNANGNINPSSDLTYGDVTFKAASKVTFTKANFEISADNFTIYAKNYPKTDADLDALILAQSSAKLTNLDTEEVLTNSQLTIDKSSLPAVTSESVSKGSYPVTLSYTRGATTISKTITFTIESTSIMTIKQVYKGTNIAIYSDLSQKTTVSNTTTYEEDIGADLTTILTGLVTNNKLTLNYTGYDTVSVSDYKVYQNDTVIDPKPTTVPDENFTVVFEYTGQLKFKETAETLDFGNVTLSSGNTTTALTSTSGSTISIINTMLNDNWVLKAAIPEGIKQTNQSNPATFIGTILYVDGSGKSVTIGNAATTIEQQGTSDLLSTVNLKTTGKAGLFLQQGAGNLKGSYSGEIVWTLADTPKSSSP